MKLKNPKFQDVNTIIFDFGNVLLDIDVSRSINAFNQLGLAKFNPEDIHPHNTGIFLDLELGLISNDDFVEKVKAYAEGGRQPSSAEVYHAWNMLLLEYDFARFELIDKLRENYKVFLLSNTNLPHREFFVLKFNSLNPAGRKFESYFDGCFYSDQMHLRKPDVRIYEQVIREIGIAPERALFIDDNAHNLVGAEMAGLHTHHLAAPITVFDLFK